MSLYLVNGTVFKTNIQQLSKILENVFEAKIDPNKDEIYISNDTFDFHLYFYIGLNDYSTNCSTYLFSSSFTGEFEEVKKFVKSIALSLYKVNILYEIEFLEDLPENNIAYLIKHPEYNSQTTGIIIDL
jgi:hypothetical protein